MIWDHVTNQQSSCAEILFIFFQKCAENLCKQFAKFDQIVVYLIRKSN